MHASARHGALTSLLGFGLVLGLQLVAPIARGAEVVRIAVDEANPPYMYGTAGAAKGVYPEIIRATFRRLGIVAQITAVPWKRAVMYLSRGEAGVGGIYKTNERMRVYAYSAPILAERLMIYTRQAFTFRFNSVADLKGKTVGVLAGWAYTDEFAKATREHLLTTEENRDDAANFDKLLLGRLDCVVATELSVKYLQHEHGATYADIVPLPTPLAVNPTYLAFVKDSAGSAFLPQFDAALRTLQETGAVDKIIQDLVQAKSPSP